MDCKAFFNYSTVTNVKSEEHWHELRATGIGGSEVSSILDVNQYQSKFELYEVKAGLKEREFVDNEAIQKGNRLEQPLFDVFKALYPSFDVIDTKDISLKHRTFAFMNANLDGALFHQELGKGVLEIKTTTIHNMSMLDNWKEDMIPINYYCQCLHYLLVTGFEYCILFALLDFPWKSDLGQQETRIRIIYRKDVLDDLEMIRSKEIEFWSDVQTGKVPEFINKKITI